MSDSRQSLGDHLATRRLDTSKFQSWLSPEEHCITFPLWNISGQLVGYQRYRPGADKTRHNDPREGRYFTRVKDDRVGVWGMESWYDSPTLFVSEGIFDASALNWFCGMSSVAVTTSTPSKQVINWFWTVRQFRKVVVICDGDAAGLKLRHLGHTYHVMPEGLDMGDANEYYIREIVERYK